MVQKSQSKKKKWQRFLGEEEFSFTNEMLGILFPPFAPLASVGIVRSKCYQTTLTCFFHSLTKRNVKTPPQRLGACCKVTNGRECRQLTLVALSSSSSRFFLFFKFLFGRLLWLFFLRPQFVLCCVLYIHRGVGVVYNYGTLLDERL